MKAKSPCSDNPERLIVLEGMPGAGTTTTIEALSTENSGNDSCSRDASWPPSASTTEPT